MTAAVFEDIDQARQIVLEKLTRTTRTGEARKYARVRGSVDHPIRFQERIDVARAANVAKKGLGAAAPTSNLLFRRRRSRPSSTQLNL